MKLLVALGLNGLLLALLFSWGRHHYRTSPLRRWLLPLLALKLTACLLACYWLSADADYFQRWGLALTAQLWATPGAWLHTLLGDSFEQKLVFHGYSNTFFVIKILSALNLASGGVLVLNALYFSLFAFVGSWELAVALARLFPATPPGAALLAFLAWPTVVYWTAGLTKECLLLGSGAWLLALALRWLYGAEAAKPATVIGGLLLVVLHFKMRFFFALLLLGALAGLAAVRVAQHLGGVGRRRWQVLLFGATLAAGGWVGSEISPVFRLNKFTNQLIRNYSELRDASRHRPHIEYDDLAPTVESMLRNVPKAVVSTLVRPMPWEDALPASVAAGLENVLLVVVLATAVVALACGRAGRLPFALVLVLAFYCLLLAALLGLSTPNLGTLNRYRAVLLPYLLLLALQNDYAARFLRRLGL